MNSARFQSKPFNITVIQVYASTSDSEEAEVEWFYENLQDLLELIIIKKNPFQHKGLECKSRKARDNWSNRQVLPWNTKWSSAKANRNFSREDTAHSKYTSPTMHETTLYKDITKWSILKSDWLHSLQLKMENWIWKSQQWPQNWKGIESFQSQRKAMTKNAQTTSQLHSSHTLVK